MSATETSRRILSQRPLRVAFWAVAMLVVLLFGRASIESYREYELGEAASQELDWSSAVIHYRHALQWYAPVGSASGAALERLVTIGDERAEAGDIETALFAYRSARVGIMAIRHLWIPHQDSLGYLDERIAALMAASIDGDSREKDVAERRFFAQLEDYPRRQVNPLLGMGAGLVFVIWLASLGSIVSFGFDSSGAPRVRRLKLLVPFTILALVGWLVLVLIA